MEEAKSVGANHAAATDDDIEIANLPLVDAVGDTVNGKTAEKLIAKLMPGTSVAATVLRASMRPSMWRQQGIRSLPASSRVRIGSTITRSVG